MKYIDEVEGIQSGRFRLVFSPKRKRKLFRRGETVWWSYNFNAWLWVFIK